MFGHFIGIASDTVLINIFIPQTKAFINVRLDDFHKYEVQALLGFEALLDWIAKQLAEERKNKLDELITEAHLANAFLSVHHILLLCNY